MTAKETAKSGADSSKWSKTELKAIKAELESERKRLSDEYAATEEGIAKLVSDSGDGAGDDIADAGSKTYEREQEMQIALNVRETIDQTDAALAKIENGTYGICESCGGPIAKARVKAFPRATLCLKCKEREERG